MNQPCVYILTNKPNGAMYVGVTSNVAQRVWHESHDNMESAIAREKALKEWKRRWKPELIEKDNPAWRDLYEDLA